jgi:hypothetical protein
MWRLQQKKILEAIRKLTEDLQYSVDFRLLESFLIFAPESFLDATNTLEELQV